MKRKDNKRDLNDEAKKKKIVQNNFDDTYPIRQH